MTKPNPTTHNPDPGYIRGLLARAGLSQRKAARAIGVDERTMRYWVSGSRDIPYLAQYALEQLANTDKT